MILPKEEILPVFFQAMLRKYTEGEPEGIILELPGVKVVTYLIDDNFKVVDSYFEVLGNTTSYGTISVCFQNNPVWVVQQNGWIEKEAQGVLNKALLKTYKKKVFAGSRAETTTIKEGGVVFTYSNLVELGNWRNFLGTEEIRRYPNGSYPRLMGQYRYSGLLLV